MWTTPPTSGMCRNTYATAAVSEEGLSEAGVPSSIFSPSSVHTVMLSGLSSL